jgi:hypothetical protein
VWFQYGHCVWTAVANGMDSDMNPYIDDHIVTMVVLSLLSISSASVLKTLQAGG